MILILASASPPISTPPSLPPGHRPQSYNNFIKHMLFHTSVFFLYFAGSDVRARPTLSFRTLSGGRGRPSGCRDAVDRGRGILMCHV